MLTTLRSGIGAYIRCSLIAGLCFVSSMLASCGTGHESTSAARGSLVATLGSGAVNVWLTTPDRNNLVAQQAPLNWDASGTKAQRTIAIDDTTTYQEIDGFGANYSDLTTYLMTYHMSEQQRESLLESLFGEKGAGFSVIRVAIGANDQVYDVTYNDRASTYADNDGATDYGLNSFSIRHDLPYIIPRLRDAQVVNPRLKILATAWWQPSWLVVRDSQTCHGAVDNGRPYLTVDPKHFDTYANLFVKYVQAYAAEGVNIWAVEPQNEPNCSGGAQQNMVLSAGNQNTFVRDYLSPAFHSNNITTGIMPEVDQYCRAKEYASAILSDPRTSQLILGPAWHGYCGESANEETIRRQFPATPHFMTEVGYSAPYDWKNLTHKSGGSLDVIAEMRNNAKAYLWHAMASSTDGNLSACPTKFCGTLFRIDRATGDVVYDMPFYVLEHFSRFARQGSVRIDSTEDGPIQDVAFRNADGSIALVVANTHSSKTQSIAVKWRGNSFSYSVPANSLATFMWPGN